ncbi:uncharacterized protein [Amphiura filiformis]|uniref:uncharacterized protein isoform X1 n=1 Tax=Amphiura filiformis TaxID=82378 RepID=UPI003B20BCA0
MEKVLSRKDINNVADKAKLGRDQLKHLFIELDIPSSDIANAERRADTRDFKLQAIEVLQFWQQSNGEKATRNEIINALEECGFIEAKEILEKKWSLISQGDAAGTSQDSQPAENEPSDEDTVIDRDGPGDGSDQFKIEPYGSLPADPEMPRYSMTHIPRGHCVVINNVDFSPSKVSKPHLKLKDRRGSDIDAIGITIHKLGLHCNC